MYTPFDPLYEERRLIFILCRDGLEEAKIFAHYLITIYLTASLKTRQKYHTRSYPCRYSYIESAFSARYLLRNGFLESTT